LLQQDGRKVGSATKINVDVNAVADAVADAVAGAGPAAT